MTFRDDYVKYKAMLVILSLLLLEIPGISLY